MRYIFEYNNFLSHNLSGIALLVDNKICLVLPRKHKGKKKYSIPKGHIEKNMTALDNAHKEMLEETGIDITGYVYDDIVKYIYIKNGVEKSLNVYVYNITLEEFSEIDRVTRNKKEITKVKLFKKEKAKKMVEKYFEKLIDTLL